MEFPKIFFIISRKKFRNFSKLNYKNLIPKKTLKLWINFGELPVNQSQEPVLEKFQRSSPKLVNMRKFNIFVTCDLSGNFYENLFE